ncbi:hypothetical protein [Empedobacter sp.]|uniref:hypothetical protein n=1 Tax=Empedobacter sp. TaxID=1927715 RepID=UPI00289E9840|nr:hypothetical protein [Empedobacter sp.]
MTDIKFTNEQLLLVLNYDTNSKEVLTLTERCNIHKAIHRGSELDRSLRTKIKELLLKIKVNNYKPKFFNWVENIDKGGFVLQQSNLKQTWNYLK